MKVPGTTGATQKCCPV